MVRKAKDILSKFNGLFAVIKPPGITSAKLLDQIYSDLIEGLDRRVYTDNTAKLFKMGHGGILDKDATGVLAVGVGKGCSLLPAFINGEKKYIGTGKLGAETDTQNSAGKVTKTCPYEHITEASLCKTLEGFVGNFMQQPPIYSALKVDGNRLSDLARAGHEVTPKPPRMVTVHSLKCTDFQLPHFTIDVHTGGGFYVRTLIRDVGEALGSCAHMVKLDRTQHGPFTRDLAIPTNEWSPAVVMEALRRNRELLKPFLDETQQKYRKQQQSAQKR